MSSITKHLKLSGLSDVDASGLSDNNLIVYRDQQFHTSDIFDASMQPNGAAVNQVAIGKVIDDSARQKEVAFSNVIKFDRDYKMPNVLVFGGLLFTIDSQSAVDGATTSVGVVADGDIVPQFDPLFRKWNGSDAYKNIMGMQNSITFMRRDGVYYYSVSPDYDRLDIPYFTSPLVLSGTAVVGMAYLPGSNLNIMSVSSVVALNVSWCVNDVPVQSAYDNEAILPYVVSTGDKGKKLTLRVRAVNAAGFELSAVSNELDVFTPVPQAPQHLTVTSVSTSEVTLVWQDPLNGLPLTGYVVQYATAGTAFATPITYNGVVSAPYVQVTGLSSSASYDFRVAAKNTFGIGLWAIVANVSYPSVVGYELDWDVANVTGSVTRGVDSITNKIYFSAGSGVGFGNNGFSPVNLVTNVGGWISVTIKSSNLDQNLIGFSTSRANIGWVTQKLNGVTWNNQSLYAVTSGTAVNLNRSITDGDMVRVKRLDQNTLVAELSGNGGLSWPTALTSWTIDGSVTWYASVYVGNGRRAYAPRYFNLGASALPSAPQSLVVSSKTSSCVKLEFADPVSGGPFVGLYMQYDKSGSVFANASPIAQVDVFLKTDVVGKFVVIADLDAATSYDIRLAARNAEGLGPWATIIGVVTDP